MTITMRIKAIELDFYNKTTCRVTLVADQGGGSLYVYVNREAAVAMPLGSLYELTLTPALEPVAAVAA